MLRDQFVIRPASNGYIIAEVRGGATAIEWVVEGDLTEVGKMIEGIAADRKLRAADMAAAVQSLTTYATHHPAYVVGIADVLRGSNPVYLSLHTATPKP